MCGIFGVTSKTQLTTAQKRFITQSTFVGTLRGNDSTGLAVIDQHGDWSTYKRALSGPDFACSSTGRAALRAVEEDAFAVIGHNRAATRGKVSDETAHPFDFPRLVGCHNGTLLGNSGLTVTTHPVDSVKLYATLDKEVKDGDVEGYTSILEKLDGSFALSWYEYETCLMYFVRNDERPLHYFQNKEGDPLFWASERGMLHWILDRCNIHHSYDQIKAVPTDTLCAFDTTTGKIASLTQYEPEDYGWGYPQYGRAYYSGKGSSYNTTTHTKSTKPVEKSRDLRNDPHYDTRVELVGVRQAIEDSLWSTADKRVAVVFTESFPAGSGSVLQFVGKAITNAGEGFEVMLWASADAIEIGTAYMADVLWIKYFEDRKGIVCISVSSHKDLRKLCFKGMTVEETARSVLDSITYYHCPWDQLAERKGEKQEDKKVVMLEDKRKDNGKISLEHPKSGDVTDYVAGPEGNFIPVEKFMELVADGCSYCEEPVLADDAADTIWEKQDDEYLPVCKHCVPEVIETYEYIKGVS